MAQTRSPGVSALAPVAGGERTSVGGAERSLARWSMIDAEMSRTGCKILWIVPSAAVRMGPHWLQNDGAPIEAEVIAVTAHGCPKHAFRLTPVSKMT